MLFRSSPIIKINKENKNKNKKDNENIINISRFSLFKNANCQKNATNMKRKSNINIYRGSYFNSNYDNSIIIRGSNLKQKILTPRESKNLENKIRIQQIKNYMEKKQKKGQNNKRVNTYKSVDFKFSYYLYLLNIFNKMFATKKLCCMNDKFVDSWEYMVNVFDVTEFIRLQTNMDLINKIIFEMKNDEDNSKSGPINKDSIYKNMISKGNKDKNRLNPSDNVK